MRFFYMQKLKSVQVDRLAHNNLCNCEQKSLLARDARFLYSALFSREKRHRQCGAFGCWWILLYPRMEEPRLGSVGKLHRANHKASSFLYPHEKRHRQCGAFWWN